MQSLDKFIADVTTPYWWLAVVLVGIAVNLLSAYLKPQLDTFYSKYSHSRQLKLQSERTQLELEAGILYKNMRLLLLKGFEEIRWFVLSIFLLLLAFALASVGTYFDRQPRASSVDALVPLTFVLLGLGLFVLALWAFHRASNISLILLRTRVRTMEEWLIESDSESSSVVRSSDVGSTAIDVVKP